MNVLPDDIMLSVGAFVLLISYALFVVGFLFIRYLHTKFSKSKVISYWWKNGVPIISVVFLLLLSILFIHFFTELVKDSFGGESGSFAFLLLGYYIVFIIGYFLLNKLYTKTSNFGTEKRATLRYKFYMISVGFFLLFLLHEYFLHL